MGRSGRDGHANTGRGCSQDDPKSDTLSKKVKRELTLQAIRATEDNRGPTCDKEQAADRQAAGQLASTEQISGTVLQLRPYFSVTMKCAKRAAAGDKSFA